MVYRGATRTGLTFHSASDGKFLKGAATGGNAGDTGSAATHTHTQSHTHTATQHSHATGSTGRTTDESESGGAGNQSAQGDHTHTFTVTNSTQNVATNTTASDASSSEPSHKTLIHLKATTPTLPAIGDIALTTETIVPTGWVLCDGNNGTQDMDGFYVKNSSTAGTTAGANTHSHTQSHGHTGSGTHTHTAGQTSDHTGTAGRNGSGDTVVNSAHSHNAPAIASVTANYDSVTTTTSTEASEPPYIKAKFIQMTFATGSGGAFLLNLL
jgi:hypothetical protein